jgi:predicted dehydrogenase
VNHPIAACLIGAGPHACALMAHRAPLGRVRLDAFAASPDGSDSDAVGAFAAQAGGPVVGWSEVVADPAIQVVLALGDAASRAEIVSAALAAGKIVLCPSPAATSPVALGRIAAAHQRGGGTLLCGGELSFCDPGQRALTAIRAPAFGELRSLYLSIRQPRGGSGDIIEELAGEAADFIISAIPGRIAHVRVNAGSLFGDARDSAVLLLRSETNAVVTVELARCLPPTLPAPGLGEIEIEAIGAREAVRAVPLASAVQIYGDDRRSLAPWFDAAVINMLRVVETAVDAPDGAEDGMARATRAGALMEAIRAAGSSDDAVRVA